MIDMAKSAHDNRLEAAAREFAEMGYTVALEPSPDTLPFDLGGYCPDLLARKNGGGVMLEIKTQLRQVSVDRLHDLAERIASHQGWRFILVTLDDIQEKILPQSETDLPGWESLMLRLENIADFIKHGRLEAGLLDLWSILEAALRKRAIAQQLPIERFPVIHLLNHLYSSGEISITELDQFKICLEKRNRIAHGLVSALDPEWLADMLEQVRSLVMKWKG